MRYLEAQARSLDTPQVPKDLGTFAAPTAAHSQFPARTATSMELLICIINQEDKLDEILSGFVELGITGATVLDSEGMGRHISEEAPVFAGLQALIARSRPRSKTILSVIDSPERRDQAIRMVQDIAGDLDSPGTGIVFAIPVTAVAGLAPKLESPEP